MNFLKGFLCIIAGMLLGLGLDAQNKITGTLIDSSNGEAVQFATVSLTKEGASKPDKYILSGDDGVFSLTGIRKGSYTFKAELLGYKPYTQAVKVEGNVDLGKVRMAPDTQMLDAASVSAVGNPIVVKKDTLEYNANAFKTTDNDMLEDLLKKLPGVEVSEDGSITFQGETIKKITIEGKTFFLDDPQLASKNIPAKLVNKLKVINKKSEQAEFTGIDDGEEEKVIDLSIKPGMMKGAFGNIMAGAGHDVPADEGIEGDWRYQGAAFIGNFTDKRQLSLILNGNNTNNRGFNDLSGSMMGNMRNGGMGGGQGGWGGGNGITTSYMAGANGSWTLFDGNMDFNSNYLYNHTGKDVMEQSNKVTYVTGDDPYNLNYVSDGSSTTKTNGHRFGIRLDHKFSENTSILFEPRVEFGNGNYLQRNDYSTDSLNVSSGDAVQINRGSAMQSGDNKNVSTSGFFLFRQRLGIPGRTMTFMGRYSFSNNDLNALNRSDTWISGVDSTINQSISSNQKSSSLWGRLTYTEPLGHNLYAELNYRYGWSRSTSEKNTYDLARGGIFDYVYSNEIENRSTTQEIGANLMYQKEKSRAQIGFAATPTNTYNNTTRYNSFTHSYTPVEYKDFRWNFSPRVMLWWEFSENANARMFYRGTSSQPSTRQLMPVPDNSDPLNVSFGNPHLTPYFSHSLRGDVRYNNKKTFASLNIRFEGSYVQNPIVSLTWYEGGAQYSMPFNGPARGSAGINGFANIPIGKSNFSVSNFARLNWSESSSYVGSNINTSTYSTDGDYYGFMDEILGLWEDPAWRDAHIVTSTVRSLGIVDRFRITYRSDALELTASARTRINDSRYSIRDDRTTTFNNQVGLTANWTWESTGITFKAEGNQNWYNGYATQQPSETVVNAEIQKLLFKKKVTFAVKGYDILGQAKNLSVTDGENYHNEVVNNTLGRYIIASLTYRFGTFDRSKMRGPGGRGPGGRR